MKYFNRLAMGTCYYPEHWDESLWLNDLQRMLKAGIGTIRIAEFAWNKFENEEGVFTFDFLIRFLDVVEQTDHESHFLYSHRDSSCMADSEISGSITG